MELKKSPQADLQNKRLLFFEIGLLVSLLSLVIAFGWGGHNKEPMLTNFVPDEPDAIEEIIPVTRQERRMPTPPKRQQQIQIVSEILQIVKDETEILTEVKFEEFEEAPISIEIPGSKVEETVDFGNEIYLKVEQEPQFMGRSWESFHYWVLRQVKYPKAAEKNKIQGTVKIQFVIEKDGSISNVEVTESPSPILSEEALRVVKLSSTHWTPGKQRNTPVRMRIEVPIDFSLE